MNAQKLYSMLKSLEYPIAYFEFDVDENNPPPTKPFIVYFESGFDTGGGDNEVLFKNFEYVIELYTSTKNSTAESKLDNLFINNGIHFSKQSTWIETESMWQTAYGISFNVII